MAIVLVAHNLRSAHNVGSLLRTAEGFNVAAIYLTGHTPYPVYAGDKRLPHIAQKVDKQIAKTALGAEKMVTWHYQENIDPLMVALRDEGFTVVALEQAPGSIKLFDYEPPEKLALIVGREVEGIEPEVLKKCDLILEIPMLGHKESFNVVQASAMALYHITFTMLDML